MLRLSCRHWNGTVLSLSLLLSGCPPGTPQDHVRPANHGDTTIAVSPDGNKLLFDAAGSGGGDLYVLDLTTMQVQELAQTKHYEASASFSPDGKRIVYSAGVPGDRADHLFIMWHDGRSPTQLTDADANDTSAQFSPDGKSIVFARDKTHQWGGLAANWELGGVICIVDTQGGKVRELTSDKEYASQPYFSADGERIEYSTPSGRMSLPVDGSEDPQPIAGPTGAIPSPDGKLIAYCRGKYMPDYKVSVAQADGTAEQVCTPDKGSCFRLAFAPTNDRVYFLCQEWPHGPTGESKLSIWQVDIDGSHLRELADSSLLDAPLRWKKRAN